MQHEIWAAAERIGCMIHMMVQANGGCVIGEQECCRLAGEAGAARRAGKGPRQQWKVQYRASSRKIQ